jgi:transposase-like protein
MPWKEVSLMQQRKELVVLVSQPEANRRELARRYGVSAKTLYKWLKRHADAGVDGLADHSRWPASSPLQTDAMLEREVLALRDAYPCRGARKLAQLLRNQGTVLAPAPSTVHEILRRHGRLSVA